MHKATRENILTMKITQTTIVILKTSIKLHIIHIFELITQIFYVNPATWYSNHKFAKQKLTTLHMRE